MQNFEKVKLKKIITVSLMTAILCVMSPFAITLPITPVPISLSTFIIYTAIIILEFKYCLISVMLYIFMGFVGLPVFTGFSGGVLKVLGPTGGYIIGYIFLIIFSYVFLHFCKKEKSLVIQFISLFIGTLVLYIIGTLWLSIQLNLTVVAAAYVGVVPFVLFDIIKMILAIIIGNKIKYILYKNNLL